MLTARRIDEQSRMTLAADQAERAGLIFRQLMFEAACVTGDNIHHEGSESRSGIVSLSCLESAR